MKRQKAAMSRGHCLRDAVQLARQLGFEVTHLRGTGAFRAFHPKLPKTVRIIARRKDTQRGLLRLLAQIWNSFN